MCVHRSHLLDIISSMEQVHYENFRDKHLEKGGLSAGMTPEKYTPLSVSLNLFRATAK